MLLLLLLLLQGLWQRSRRRSVAFYHTLLQEGTPGALGRAHHTLLDTIAPGLFLAAAAAAAAAGGGGGKGVEGQGASAEAQEQLLQLLEPLAERAGVLGGAWELGGGLYYSYLGLVSLVPGVVAEGGGREEVVEEVVGLQQRVALAQGSSTAAQPLRDTMEGVGVGREAAVAAAGLWVRPQQRCVLERMAGSLQQMLVALGGGVSCAA
jgi:hypothetical protein